MPRDVMDFPLPVVPEGTTRHGLVIGIDKYADERLNLRCAVADARALRDLMVDAECGCFPNDNVQLLLDHQATTEGIFRALARLRRQVADEDVVWIYYAGHAAVQDSTYWVTHDADVDDLFATALSSDRIASVLSQLRTRRLLLILDCCHAAAMALVKNPTRQIVTSKDLFGRFGGHGTITLAASDGRERSVELSEVGHGAFTYFLEKGLRGAADADNDGIVTADELWSYLRGKVTEASGRAGNPQTPMLIGAMTHDVPLTLNAAVTANRQSLLKEIEGLVGLRAHQLTTDEARYCEQVVLRGTRSDVERFLIESLEELATGQLTQAQFRRFVQMARATTTTAAAEALVNRAQATKKEGLKVTDIKAWDRVKGMPRPTPSLDIEGVTWVLVDEIEILNKESEERHLFQIKEVKDSFRSRQKLMYPDGTTVEDTGRAHVDGYSEFRVMNITPGLPVVVLRRIDYIYGDYELELSVNGKRACIVACVGTDRAHRWRNWPALITPDHVNDVSLIIRQQSMSAGRDINMFHIWIYQPR